MSKQFLMLCAICALFLVSCEKNTQNYSVRNSTFYARLDGEGDYTECFLLFDKPHNGLVTDSSITKTYEEQPSGISVDPIAWTYYIDGIHITLDADNEFGHQTRYATFKNDTIYFKNCAYYRL